MSDPIEDETLKDTVPGYFQIKVIGEQNENFEQFIFQQVKSFFPKSDFENSQCHASKQGRYVSWTLRLYIEDESTLPVFYEALKKHASFRMVL